MELVDKVVVAAAFFTGCNADLIDFILAECTRRRIPTTMEGRIATNDEALMWSAKIRMSKRVVFLLQTT